MWVIAGRDEEERQWHKNSRDGNSSRDGNHYEGYGDSTEGGETRVEHEVGTHGHRNRGLNRGRWKR